MQVGFLYFLEKQINGGPAVGYTPPQLPTPKVVEKVVNLQAAQVSDLKAAYAKDYLAYSDSTGLQVVNVKTGKLVFTENKPENGEILYYSWLPDRNRLLLLEKERAAGKTATLYDVEFPDPDQDVQPVKQEDRKIDNISGKIEAVDVSTLTNLIYMLVKAPNGQIVYEINVMKKIRPVSKPGEKIFNVVTSDIKGTLYIQSRYSNVDQIVAVKSTTRVQVLSGSQYELLGVQDKKVFVGNVEDGNLTKILSVPDTSSQEKTSKETTVEWQGSVPWKKNYKAIIGPENYWVFYNQEQAVAFQNGKVKEVKFTSPENYLTQDGREYMQVDSSAGNTVKVTIKPL